MTEFLKPTHYLPVRYIGTRLSGQACSFVTTTGVRTVEVPNAAFIPIPESALDRKLRVGDRLRATRDRAFSIDCKAGDVGTVIFPGYATFSGDVKFAVNGMSSYVIPADAARAAAAGWELIEPDINAESEVQAKFDALLAELDVYVKNNPIERHNLRSIVARYRPTPAERLRLAVRDGGVPDGDARRAILDVAAELELEAGS